MPHVNSGEFRLTRQGATSRLIDFWNLSLGETESRVFTVWSNELPELIDCLDALSRLDLTEPIPPTAAASRFYPLHADIHPTGGIVAGLFTKPGRQPELSFRRLTNSFRGRNGKKVYLSRFFYAGKPIWETRAPLSSGLLQDLASAAIIAKDSFLNELEAHTNCEFSRERSVSHSAARVVFQGYAGGKSRSGPFEHGYDKPQEFEYKVLEKPLPEILLAHVSAADDLKELAALIGHAVNTSALSFLLNWCTRYTPLALAGGFFANPTDGATRVRALQDKSVFASDPSLSALAGRDVTHAESTLQEPILPTPQYRERSEASLRGANEQGWVAATLKTPLGQVGIPTDERAKQLLNLAAPGSTLARQRWLVLQALHLKAGCLSNQRWLAKSEVLPTTDFVLLIQQVALLLNDVRHFFAEDFSERPDIQAVMDAAAETWSATWAGPTEPAALIQPSEFPRSSKNDE